MKYSVAEDVKKKTTMCSHEFTCLESGLCGDRPLCEVSQETPGVLFVKQTDLFVCPYCRDFGGARYCACPTHMAIVKKYGRRRPS